MHVYVYCMYICIDIYNLNVPNNNIIRNTRACILLLLYGFQTMTCLNCRWGGLGNVRLITSRPSANNKLKAPVQRRTKTGLFSQIFQETRKTIIFFYFIFEP